MIIFCDSLWLVHSNLCSYEGRFSSYFAKRVQIQGLFNKFSIYYIFNRHFSSNTNMKVIIYIHYSVYLEKNSPECES